MAEFEKDQLANLKRLVESNTEILHRMEGFLQDLDDRLQSTGEALLGKKMRHHPDFASNCPKSPQRDGEAESEMAG